MIAAILRAQLLSLRRMGAKQGATATILSILPPLFYYGLWCFFGFGAWAVFREIDNFDQLGTILAGALAGVFFYWQIAPVITASMGASLDLQKLIVYPINRDKLFLVEVSLRFLTVLEMLIVLTGISLGLLANPVLGGRTFILRVAAGDLLFITFNLLLAAGVRSLIERLFRNKRTREFAMLFFVLLTVLPSVVLTLGVKFSLVARLVPSSPLWPWGAVAALFLGRGALLSVPVLLGWIALAYSFGRRQFYRSLNSDPYSGITQVRARRWRLGSHIERAFRLPSVLWRDPMAAMIEKDLRTLSRSAAFRMAFIMGFTFGLLVFLPNVINPDSKRSAIGQHFFVWVSMYSLLLIGYYTFWDAFGLDRNATQIYFLTPVSVRQVLYAKNIVAIVVQAVEVAVIGIVMLVAPIPLTRFGVVEAITVTAVTCLYLFALGNLNSLRFPSPIDPDKMSRGAGTRGRNVITTLLLPVGFLPVLLAYWGRYVFKSDLVFFLLLALAAIIGAIFYWIAMDSAVELANKRREQIIGALSVGGGPMAAS
jgi:ABC-2 type transport system permease protein